MLRRLGMRERVGHVVNRSRPGCDLGEVLADLGVEVVAEIPDDRGFVDAENAHRLAGLDGSGEVAEAVQRLVTSIEQEAVALTAPDASRRGGYAG